MLEIVTIKSESSYSTTIPEDTGIQTKSNLSDTSSSDTADTNNQELLSARIYRKFKKTGLSSLDKKERLLAGAFITERAIGAYLLFCQAALTAGLPISNKFSTNYDVDSNENMVTFENWINSKAPVFFVASTLANAIFTYTLIGIIEEKAKNIKDLVTNKDYRKIILNLALESLLYGLAFAAASYDSKNAEDGLKEIGISETANSLLSWSGHAAMTFMYRGALSLAEKSDKDKGDLNIMLECFKGFNAIYGTPAVVIGGFRTYGMISQMTSKVSPELDTQSQIIEFAKISGACLSFAFLTAKSLARIREPIFNFGEFVSHLPKKAIGYCATAQNNYVDLERPAEIVDTASNSNSKALLAFGLGLILIATTINAYGNAYLADDKSKTVLNTLGMIAVAICSWAICSANAPEIFGFKSSNDKDKRPSNTLNPTVLASIGQTNHVPV